MVPRVSERTRRRLALTLAAALVAGPALADRHDCTYDQADQIRVLRELARRHRGGRVEESERRVTWARPSGGTDVVTYGGCADLGMTATRTEPRAAALPPERVFAVANDLAARYWAKADADDLGSGLTARAYQTEEIDGRTYYHVRHELYSQFYVEHEFANGTSRVAIAWSRSF